jgi:3-methyladenine DNA glycosylase AlkD
MCATDLLESVTQKLIGLGDPNQIEGMARYGMSTHKRLGIKIPVLRSLAKEIGVNHELAIRLWDTGIAEARILASMVADPNELTEALMDSWAADFNSWDVCDQVCMNLFDKSPLAWKKVAEWSKREEEYVKRAAFALIACLAWHDKRASDEQFIQLLPIIKAGSTDERDYVKKGVSWALRHIGKRNLHLNRIALDMASEIEDMESKSSRWIASDVTRDLTRDKIQQRLMEEA